jgi:tetratricopeptide (TPR) repeat protein
VLNRRPWVINLVVAVSILSLAGFTLLPVFNAILEGGPAIAKEPNGLSSSQIGQLQAQAEGYTKVLQREPENQVALKGLLDARLQLGDIKGSLPPLEKIAALNPKIADYTVLLAQTKQYLGDRESAAAHYRQVLISQPQNINALQGLVSLLIDSKRPAAAIGVVEDSIKRVSINITSPTLANDLIPLKLLLGQIYVTQQRHTDAIVIYNELIGSNKQDFRPVLAKAIVLKQIGNLTEARSLMDAATELAPAEYKDRVRDMAQATQPPKAITQPNLTTSPQR